MSPQEQLVENAVKAKAKPARIQLAHGAGGQLTDELVKSHVLPRLGNDVLNELLDAAIIDPQHGSLAMTIDSFVVRPWKFPGGDIGRLAICGTINDLAVSGAKPAGIALAMILAEGLPISVMDDILDSVSTAAKEAQVQIVTGDTKVVGHDQADGIFLITAGVGRIPARRTLGPAQVKPGQVLVINGPIGEHGLAVMMARELPEAQLTVKSDVAPLNGLIDAAFSAVPNAIAFLRDPTRGGLAGVCSDLARQCGFRIILDEAAIQVRPEVRSAAEIFGLDPLDIANEGKVVMAVSERVARRLVAALRAHPLGRDAAIIGRVDTAEDGICELQTLIGGRRIVQKAHGEEPPRIF